jgi:HAE1 family hydrophobic/amphiphilic exporter-1
VDAGRTRLRPILMTALATIFALVPLAIPVIGGLITSTFLTLLVVAVGYSRGQLGPALSLAPARR